MITQTLQNKQPLEIYAPAGIKELLGERLFVGRGAIKLIQIHKRMSRFPRLPDDIVAEGDGTFRIFEDANIRVTAAHIMHSVFSLGYVVEEIKRPR